MDIRELGGLVQNVVKPILEQTYDIMDKLSEKGVDVKGKDLKKMLNRVIFMTIVTCAFKCFVAIVIAGYIAEIIMRLL